MQFDTCIVQVYQAKPIWASSISEWEMIHSCFSPIHSQRVELRSTRLHLLPIEVSI